jgi:hypothetical protein
MFGASSRAPPTRQATKARATCLASNDHLDAATMSNERVRVRVCPHIYYGKPIAVNDCVICVLGTEHLPSNHLWKYRSRPDPEGTRGAATPRPYASVDCCSAQRSIRARL